VFLFQFENETMANKYLPIPVYFSGKHSLQILLITCSFGTIVKMRECMSVDMTFNVFYSTFTDVFFIIVSFYVF